MNNKELAGLLREAGDALFEEGSGKRYRKFWNAANELEAESVEPVQSDERRLSDLGNELHNLSCSMHHSHEDWADEVSGIAVELWQWHEDHRPPAPAVSVPDDALYLDATRKWGADVQSNMAMGECGELIAALNRYVTQGRDNLPEVIDEIADVGIMVRQLELIYGEQAVAARRTEKREKLRGIINGTVSHPHAAAPQPGES